VRLDSSNEAFGSGPDIRVVSELGRAACPAGFSNELEIRNHVMPFVYTLRAH
jgi:hypothetical protein